jgi:ankyrin repeat protein
MFVLIGPSKESVLHMALDFHLPQPLQQSHNVANNGETIAMIRLLIAGGADCNAINALGETPLYRACAAGLEDVVKILLEAGSSVDTMTTNRFPLVAACASGNSRIVEQLLKAGALVNVKAIHPLPGHATLTTPLCVAAMYGHSEIVGLLLQRGAFTDVRDELGETVVNQILYRVQQRSRRTLKSGINTVKF